MKKYNQFVNEGIRDKMTPKSKDDIKKSLDELAPRARIQTIYKNQVQDLYTDKELKDIFNQLPPNIKIDTVLNLKAGNLYTEDELKNYFKDTTPKEKIEKGTLYNLLWLIKYGVENLPKRPYNWQSLFNIAVHRNIEILKYLLDNLTIRPHDLDRAIYSNDNSDNKNKEEVKKLLIDKKRKIIVGKENYDTILKHACESGDYDLAKSAIDNGAKVKDIDLLYRSISSKNIKIVKLLIENGIDIKPTNFYPTPIGSAIKNNSVEIVKLLVEHGVEIEFSGFGVLNDVIDWIKKGENDEMIRYLITKSDEVKEKIQEHINKLQNETKLYQKYL